MVIQVIVSTYEGQKITVDLCQDEKQLQLTTVLQLKQKIALKLPGKRMTADMKLIFADKRLDSDNKLLCEFGIVHKSLIQMVMSLDGGRGA
uniref:Ubiquitin-like domain-containing protein n=1 Tax=Oryzias latipes TaxID=8090 RepID=A0A3B3HH68_ORYLA